MNKLIVYDTSNYINFPIGGQLTSVHNFLLYLSECHKAMCRGVLLVGVTTIHNDVGILHKLKIGKFEFDFLPVVYRNSDLSNVKNSLRLQFTKGIFKYSYLINSSHDTIHYIHSPEAFFPIKLLYPKSKIVVFSHGNFYNMTKGFRFFENNIVVKGGFNLFLKWLLSRADLIFTLDDDSYNSYIDLNSKIEKVDNSIILPYLNIDLKRIHTPIRLLYVGRLSKVKRVDQIIIAAEKIDCILTIVGDGEEGQYLRNISKSKKIRFTGAINPSEVMELMLESDILIMNSLFEGKPMTILEAMSCGLPIVTTNVGGIKELVRFNKNAIEVDGSSTSIISAVKKIKSNHLMYAKSSRNISKKYDYKKINKQIYSCLSKIINAK